MKIGDFGLACVLPYPIVPDQNLMYAGFIPPECKDNFKNFNKKSDVYVSKIFFSKTLKKILFSFMDGF